MKRHFILFLIVFAAYSVFAQSPAYVSSSEIKDELRKLKITGTVLYIAAHPDDENTRLISYLTKERGFRVGYLSLTRGDGGQNLIGNEQGEDLGIIRTQELLAARRIDGAEQFFTRAYDFGYSKTPEETFEKWNKEDILEDVVHVIRYFKPDIIICRFPTTGEGGHGHHTASAILAKEAFDVAADHTRYPSQVKQLGTWQAQRIFWNTYSFGSTNTTSEDQLKINVGGYNSLTGKSYGEIAAESRSQHRSQGFGSERRRGDQFEYFKLIWGTAAKTDLFDGINPYLSPFKNSGALIKQIDKIITSFNEEYPEKSIPALHKLKFEMRDQSFGQSNSFLWYQLKTRQIDLLIQKCSGLFVEVISATPLVTPGDTVRLKLQMINRSSAQVKFSELETRFGTIKADTLNLKNGILEPNKWYSFDLKFVKSDLPYTSPYQHRYKNTNEAKRYYRPEMPLQWKPEWRWETEVFATFYVENFHIMLPSNVHYKYVDPSFGEVYQPFVIAPKVSVTADRDHYLIEEGSYGVVTVKIKLNSEKADGVLRLSIPDGWKTIPDSIPFRLSKHLPERDFSFTLTRTNGAATGHIQPVVNVDGKEYRHSLREIAYDHIPKQIMYDVTPSQVTELKLRRTALNIGYYPGAGDKIADVLSQFRYLDIKVIDKAFLLSQEVKKMDVIIVGVRAFNTDKELNSVSSLLMNFVKDGGRLIVQYNTNQPLVTNYVGPFPFKISRDRVTEENAKVTILKPDHYLLNYPNKITEADFENWVQERGLYFPTEADSNYVKLFSMADSASPALETGLLYARYGKGDYIYTSLAFFRQLPAGNPGAIRLFINLITHSREPKLPREDTIHYTPEIPEVPKKNKTK